MNGAERAPSRMTSSRMAIHAQDPRTSAIYSKRSDSKALLRKLHALEAYSPFGAYLEPQELRQIARTCKVVKFQPGKPLLPSPFYLVLDGVIAVTNELGNVELCLRKTGSFFTHSSGEGSANTVSRKPVQKTPPPPPIRSRQLAAAPGRSKTPPRGSASRSSVARSSTTSRTVLSGMSITRLLARTPGELLLLYDEAQLDEYRDDWSDQARAGYDAIVSTNIVTVLSQVSFIKESLLAQGDLRHLGELCHYRALPPNEEVFRSGDPADCFYIILKGAAKLKVTTEELEAKSKVTTDESVHGGGRRPALLRRSRTQNNLMADESVHGGSRNGRSPLAGSSGDESVHSGSRHGRSPTANRSGGDESVHGGSRHGRSPVASPVGDESVHGASRHGRRVEEVDVESEVDTELTGITAGCGETFGVAALVLGAPTRTYGMVTTNETSLFLSISKEEFQPFLATNPALEYSLLLNTKHFLLQRYALHASSIFHSFTEDELHKAAKLATVQHLAKDEVLYRPGDSPDAFYVLAHGKVERDFHNGSAPEVLSVGSYFGEVGVLLPRTQCFSTIRAVDGATLLAFGRESFILMSIAERPVGKLG